MLIHIRKRKGYTKLARNLKQWPEYLSDEAMDALDAILKKQQEGKPITSADTDPLELALSESPEAAPLLIVTALTETTSAPDPASQTEEILNSYSFILNLACEYMGNARTSLALKGFVHSPDCISYWMINRPGQPQFQLSDKQLVPRDFEIYLLQREPTPEELDALNLAIRTNAKRHLSDKETDYKKDQAVRLLTAIEDVRIVVEGLPEDRPDPFALNSLPKTLEMPIEPGAPSLFGMLASFYKAQDVQDEYLVKAIDNRRTIENALKAAAVRVSGRAKAKFWAHE